MREVIDNGSMPKNMRQIGEPGTGIRILVEDYAYTYLCQLARENEYGDAAGKDQRRPGGLRAGSHGAGYGAGVGTMVFW